MPEAARAGAPIRVLHFFKTYRPDSFGGVERVIAGIAAATASFGVETSVLSLSRDPGRNSVMVDGHMAHKVHLDVDIASTGLSFGMFGRFRELAAASDIVHCHFPWPGADISNLLVRTGKPKVVTYHSDIIRQRLLKVAYLPLMHTFLGGADRIVATSPNYLASSPVLTRYRDKASIIPIGLEREWYPAPDSAATLQWHERFPRGMFLFVGVHRYYKGLPFLIEAARSTGLPVVIAGSGKREAEYRRQAEGIDNVVFTGEVSEAEKAALIEVSVAGVLPSHLRAEAFGVALLEMAMRGRPLISCAVESGTSFVNVDGETGIEVRPADADALADAMQRLWQDRELAADLGRGAAARYERLFTGRRMGAAYASLYRELVAGATAGTATTERRLP